MINTEDLRELYPWEPPVAGTEVGQLLGALDRQRTTFRWKVDDLDAAGLRVRVSASSLTLGGLLKHLARAEAQIVGPKLDGSAIGPPWDGQDWDGDEDWDFNSAEQDSPEQLYALWDRQADRSRERITSAIADGGLDRPVAMTWPDGRRATLRRLLFDLLEEYARHTGHADLLREAVDGRVGEDPPAGWRPVSGRYTIARHTDDES